MSAETPNRRGFFAFVAGSVAAPFVPVPKPPAIPPGPRLSHTIKVYANGVELKPRLGPCEEAMGRIWNHPSEDDAWNDLQAQFFTDHP